MRRAILLALLVLVGSTGTAVGQTGPAATSAEPFKVGTFEVDGEPRVGIVLRDQLVVDLIEANQTLQRNPIYAEMPMPEDMIGLISRYEYGLKYRVYEIVNDLVEGNRLTSATPDYVYAVDEIRTLAPIPRPGKIMNTAVNFYTHIAESGSPEQRQAAIDARRANRGVPYMFLKASSSVIGNDDTIVMPYGRTELDWEIELATVIGRAARYVPATQAQDHVFGYTVMLDISDRGGRPPGGFSSGVDWFVMKGQDTFGPMGPYIVPKEFYGDPMAVLSQSLNVGDEQMQQSDAGDMIHSIWEVIEYASSIATLYPGDIIGAGTSGGVGMGTSVRGEQVWLVPGDEITGTIAGIGTLHLSVAAAPPPTPGTGTYLPPVDDERRRGQ